MKKTLLLILAALGMTATSQAADFDYGVEAGVGITRLNTSGKGNTFGSNNRVGFFVGPKIMLGVGAGCGFNLAAHYTLLDYSLKGDVVKSTSQGSSHEVYDKHKYQHSLELPLNFRYSFGISHITSIYAETGPQLGFNVGDRRVGGLFKNDNMLTTWNVGGGLRINDVELGLRYNFCLSRVGKAVMSNDVINLVGSSNAYKRNTFFVQLAYYI